MSHCIKTPRFVARGEYQGCVCKIKMALYCIKKSLRAWFGKFTEAVLEFGLQICRTSHSVFHLQTRVGYNLLVIYVDNIVIIGNYSGGIA